MKLSGAQEATLNDIAASNSLGRNRKPMGNRATLGNLQRRGLVEFKADVGEYRITEKGREWLIATRGAVPCKIGTQTALVLLKHTEIKRAVGERIEFRFYPVSWGPWETAVIDKVNEDGYLFASLI